MKILLYLLPRILSALITAFWCAFVFSSHGLSFEALVESGIWVILLILTVFSWKEMLIGKLGFIIFGMFYIVVVWSRTLSKLVILEVAGPMLLTGVLFLFSKKEYRPLNFRFIKPKPTKKLNNESAKPDNGII